MPQSPDPSAQTVIYVHIPKAAGTSFKKVLDKNYRQEDIYFLDGQPGEETFKSLSDSEKQRYRLIYGHQYFGLHAHMPQPATYITILRDPIERAISHYYFVRRVEHNDIHERAMQVSLADYVLQEVAGKELDNGQTRRLAGVRTEGDCTPAMLEQAKANLREHFSLVGLSERFDETLFLARQVFKWSPQWSSVFYKRLNQTLRPKADGLTPDVVELLHAKNEYDLQLYAFVEQELTAQVRAQPLSYHASLRGFQVINWFYGLPYHSANYIKRRFLS